MDVFATLTKSGESIPTDNTTETRTFRSTLEPPIVENNRPQRSPKLCPGNGRLTHKRSGSMVSQVSTLRRKTSDPPKLKRSNSSELDIPLEKVKSENTSPQMTSPNFKLKLDEVNNTESKTGIDYMPKIRRIRIMGDIKTGKTSKNKTKKIIKSKNIIFIFTFLFFYLFFI